MCIDTVSLPNVRTMIWIYCCISSTYTINTIKLSFCNFIRHMIKVRLLSKKFLTQFFEIDFGSHPCRPKINLIVLLEYLMKVYLGVCCIRVRVLIF